MELDHSRLQALARHVTDTTRRFNLREGLTTADDRLPERLLTEGLEDGQRITEDEMEALTMDYYRARGWSRAGVPTELDE